MLKLSCIVFCVIVAIFAQTPSPPKDATRVIKDHFGERTQTTPYIGQLSTIRDARTLNCQFSQIQTCCWYNMPKPMDDLDWVMLNNTVEKVRFWAAYGGKTIRIPDPPFLVTTAASQSSSERAMLVSCAIPCQNGAGQLTLVHWLDQVELNICRVRVNSQTVVEPCANIKGTGVSTVLVDSLPDPFYVAIMATGFGPNGVAAIDDLRYSASIPATC